MANALKIFCSEITLTVKQFGTLTLQNDDFHRQCVYHSNDIKVNNSRKLKWTGWERKVLGTTEIERFLGNGRVRLLERQTAWKYSQWIKFNNVTGPELRADLGSGFGVESPVSATTDLVSREDQLMF